MKEALSLIELIANETGHAIYEITNETRLDSLVTDSLELLSLFNAFEAQYGQFPSGWITRIETVGHLEEIARTLVQAQ